MGFISPFVVVAVVLSLAALLVLYGVRYLTSHRSTPMSGEQIITEQTPAPQPEQPASSQSSSSSQLQQDGVAQARDDASAQTDKGATATTTSPSADLPNTGPATDLLMAAVAIGALSASGLALFRSRYLV